MGINRNATKIAVASAEHQRLKGEIAAELDRVFILFENEKGEYLRFNGNMQGKDIVGYYTTASGDLRDFRAKFRTRDEHPSRSSSSDTILIESKFTYPFMAYRNSHYPVAKSYLIYQTSVWTH